MKYSVCITNYNSIHGIRSSLESLFRQLDDQFEVVVVDNFSSDGSREVLEQYEKLGKLRLFTEQCSRGLGRRIAVEKAEGEYVIGQVDMDEILAPNLTQLLAIYHKYYEGYMLKSARGLFVAPKTLIQKVGGFHDLNYLEDKDLYARVAAVESFRYLLFRTVARSARPKERHVRLFMQKTYDMYRDAFRIGQLPTILLKATSKSACKKALGLFVVLCNFLSVWAGFLTHWFYPRYRNLTINRFVATDYMTQQHSALDHNFWELTH